MATNYSPSIVTDSLVLSFDPADLSSIVSGSTTVNDLSGNLNSGSLNDGKIGKDAAGSATAPISSSGAFHFDGTDYISVSDGADFTFGTNPFSIELWLKFTDFTPGGDVWNCPFQIYRVEGDRHGFFLFYNNSSTFEWRLESSANGFYPPIVDMSAAGITLDQWHCIAISRQSEAVFKQYMDGQLLQTSTAANGENAGRGGTYSTNWLLIDGTVFVGNYATGDPHEFQGEMGPVRVYKGRALSDDELRQNFESQRTRFGV